MTRQCTLSRVKFIAAVVCLFFSHQTEASPQVPDYVIFKGDTIPIYALILEDYFHQIDTPDKGQIFGLSFRENSSTSCWRGYQAVFTIENDSLFLKYILSCGELRKEKGVVDAQSSNQKISALFKDKFKRGKVFVFWWSGRMAFPYAHSQLLRWDGVFSRTYYKEEILSINKGLLENDYLIDNYIDLPNGISRDLPEGKVSPNKGITDTIFSAIKRLNWKKLSDCDCDDKYYVVIGTDGRVEDVKLISWTNDPKMMEEDIRDHRKCIRRFKNSLKRFQFDIVKWSGQPYQEKIWFEIFYNQNGVLENWSVNEID